MQIWHATPQTDRIPQLLSTLAIVLAGFLTGCATVEPGSTAGSKGRDQTVRLQIFLDERHFGPGVVDGSEGEFTSKALERYNEARGLPAGSQPDVSAIEPYSTYMVTSEDAGVLGTMAVEPADIAKQKRLPYTTLSELVAERYHTTAGFLAVLNPGKDLTTLAPGDVVRVPNVARPFHADKFPSTYPAPSASVAGNRRVLVDLNARMLEVREGPRLLAAFPITPGSAEHPAPVGEWKIVGAVPWPWYRYDEGVLKRGERTETFFLFPPGVNSPVGVLWAGTNRPGVGIHGTPNPDTIGRAGSHGCIRLANWDAAAFYTLIGKGTPVTIR
jgi:lipoprotein-anchoring transpeptidase ErfK/SrfK